jgi:hypothetical protein
MLNKNATGSNGGMGDGSEGITCCRRDFVSGDSPIPDDFPDLEISGQDLIDKNK